MEIDLNNFENELNDYIDKLLPAGVKEGVGKACLIVERDAKIECPIDEGILRASITHNVEVNNSSVDGYVGTNNEIALYVHQGTGIYAAEGNGRQTPWIYVDKNGKKVRTVGQKPKPFLKNAVDKNKDKISKIIEKSLK